ncbi:MAG: hypothetical protein WCI11_21455, partial [Candidatus Methylumidiphilus sp.]
KALLMGVDFSMTGRNKPVHGRFRHKHPDKCGLLRRKHPLGRVYSGLHGCFSDTVRNIRT